MGGESWMGWGKANDSCYLLETKFQGQTAGKGMYIHTAYSTVEETVPKTGAARQLWCKAEGISMETDAPALNHQGMAGPLPVASWG